MERTFEAVITPHDIVMATKFQQAMTIEPDTILRLTAAYIETLPPSEKMKFLTGISLEAAKHQ